MKLDKLSSTSLLEVKNYTEPLNGLWYILGRFKYKDEYEKFKLALSTIAMLMSVTNLLCNVRALDLAFVFLMVSVFFSGLAFVVDRFHG